MIPQCTGRETNICGHAGEYQDTRAFCGIGVAICYIPQEGRFHLSPADGVAAHLARGHRAGEVGHVLGLAEGGG